MTVSESIINWLYGFNSEEFWSMPKIDTDLQGAKVDSFSLIKEPVQNVKSYVSGRKVYTEHYMIRARLSSNLDIERIENLGFGEVLEEYVKAKNLAEEYPNIPDAKVRSIGVTTPFYLGVTENNNSIYQMTIAIQYEKEK